MSIIQDALAIIKGAQIVAKEGLKVQRSNAKVIWNNSSVRTAAEQCSQAIRTTKYDPKNSEEIVKILADGGERMTTVLRGIQAFATNAPGAYTITNTKETQSAPKFLPKFINSETAGAPVKEVNYEIKLTSRDKELLKKLDMEHQKKIEKSKKEVVDIASPTQQTATVDEVHRSDGRTKIKVVPNPKSKQSLSASAKQRTVPSSRIGRLLSFGGLAAGLGIGTAAEYARRTLGLSKEEAANDLFMTPANMDRIVDTLCKVRGAALKLGQVLSIQDETILSPPLAKALERVRKSADFMPSWQVDQVLQTELGPGWKDRFSHFEEKPFAAASIGQVHSARLKGTDKEVAVKIQYPGVAKGIESDIDNLVAIIKIWDMFPKGMFLDNLIRVSKRELAWEVDYIREAECQRKFRKLLQPYPEYYVPDVIGKYCLSYNTARKVHILVLRAGLFETIGRAFLDDLSTGQVFTSELIEGIPVDQCADLDLEHRNYVAAKIMELTLLELFEFRYMQTDPNWANFFYDPKKKQILLLDFGASREYSKEFMDSYVKILRAAADGDRETVLRASRTVGFLTGYESKIMEEAHVDAVMILGEVFRCPVEFNFAEQDTTAKITNLMPTMMTHRLCPPPDEVYSLHRKFSGVFLLCAKLKAKIPMRETFLELSNKYQYSQ